MSGRNGLQVPYDLGEEIADARGATLHSVFPRFVLIDRGGGRLQRLSMIREDDQAEGFGRVNSRINAPARPQPTAPADPAEQVSLIASMSEVAGTIGQAMSLAPHTENGETVGYRLQPNGEIGNRAFSELGLEPGDVLREVNGIALNDARNAAQVIAALGESPQASVTIRRNGEDMPMYIDMNQLTQIVESLQ